MTNRQEPSTRQSSHFFSLKKRSSSNSKGRTEKRGPTKEEGKNIEKPVSAEINHLELIQLFQSSRVKEPIPKEGGKASKGGEKPDTTMFYASNKADIGKLGQKGKDILRLEPPTKYPRKQGKPAPGLKRKVTG